MERIISYVTLEPGTYAIGDPALALSAEDWHNFIPIRHEEVIHTFWDRETNRSSDCWMITNFGGDGEFDDDDGFTYKVVSGCFGITASALCKRLDERYFQNYMRIITFDHEVVAIWSREVARLAIRGRFVNGIYLNIKLAEE